MFLDAGEILALINSYASSDLMLPRGPKYFYENLRDFVVVEVVGERTEPKIVACGSLHVLWKDIAEIRALAVHPRFWRRGLGSKIVRYLIEEARQMGIEKVFAFTLEEEWTKIRQQEFMVSYRVNSTEALRFDAINTQEVTERMFRRRQLV